CISYLQFVGFIIRPGDIVTEGTGYEQLTSLLIYFTYTTSVKASVEPRKILSGITLFRPPERGDAHRINSSVFIKASNIADILTLLIVSAERSCDKKLVADFDHR